MEQLKVRKIGNGYGVLLPKHLLDQLAVGEGSFFEAENHDGVLQMKPVDAEFSRQVAALMQVEVEHRSSLRELAKR